MPRQRPDEAAPALCYRDGMSANLTFWWPAP
ncbi:hypothetical protein EV279_2996 [Microbacterium sp. BK668]|nr:hypothetical protein EV279_2996 [Microbacterium sp. BK668]